MYALRLLLSVPLLGFVAMAAHADGVKSKGVALPAPQPSVAVTVERGVRVWRPLGTDGGGAYPQAVSLNSGSEPSVQYVMPNGYGVTGVYGGFGGFGSGQRHERWNGVSSGTRHVNVNIKGWGSRAYGPKFGNSSGRHHGGMIGGGGPKHVGLTGKAGGPKHVAFAVNGGGAKHVGGHGRGHH